MANFFLEGSGTGPVNFVPVGVDKTVQVGVWDARVNGQFLVPSCNDPTVATISSTGTSTPDGMIRGIGVKGLRPGNVMLEARLNGVVLAYTQIVVSKEPVGSGVGPKAVEIARDELKLGVFEDDGNTNTGERIDMYEQLFGFRGLAWCAMFVHWCFHTAAASMAVANPFPKIAGAQQLWAWGKKNERVVTAPEAGDVLIVKPGTHVGLVVGPPSGGKVPSIEGNTWQHGTKESHRDGVYQASHATTTCYYLRL